MILSFTGTRNALKERQVNTLREFVTRGREYIEAGHHGDCVGADAIFDLILSQTGIERHVHPGYDKRGRFPYRAYCQGEHIYQPLPYLDRNKVMVHLGDIVLACPGGPDVAHSGTWSTIWYAHHQNKPVIIIWPDGSIESRDPRVPSHPGYSQDWRRIWNENR